MTAPDPHVASAAFRVVDCGPDAIEQRLPAWESFLARHGAVAPGRLPGWLLVLQRGLGHVPTMLEARGTDEEVAGILPVAFVRSRLFGRYLVSLPYLNVGGVVADRKEVADALVDRAVTLADALDVKYLELRHEAEVPHEALGATRTEKVHMRLALPSDPDVLWKQLKAKVRNQVRKGESNELSVAWGREERLDAFYAVFSRNMRDLGTPVFGKKLFREILAQFPQRAELCTVELEGRTIAAALLVHGASVTEVPSASSLRRFNATCANMFMYWHLLKRAVERGQKVFDFGRSSADSSTYRFKKQWGAEPHPACWQYYLRSGSGDETRPDNPRYQRMIRIWQRLPLPITRLIGPVIVRGIP